MRRTIYFSIFVVLSVIAGAVYYNHTREAPALVATHDLSVGTRIQSADVALRSVNPASLEGAVLRNADQAVGQTVSSPIFQGQFVDARQLAASSNAAMLAAGLQLPQGDRIIGLPITPAAAVGGALKPGDLVDVLAIPNPAKEASLLDQPVSPPTVLGKDVLVVGLRTDDGAAVVQTGATDGSNAGKAGSVLLAIPAGDEITYSGAMATSTFVLTLSTG
jgi:Flp pilus assembly protein CpaB